jgi:DNA-binding FrmR family transcriptional regulator
MCATIKREKTERELLNTIRGQIDGIARMIDTGRDCIAVLTQLKAVRSATESLIVRYAAAEAGECLKEKGGPAVRVRFDKLLKELIIK